jgi:ribonuclease Z
VRIHFLGTGAGNFRGSRRQPCSAFLDGLLLDCGAGATGRLHDLGRFDAVDAVLITHLHSDHIAGLTDLLLHTVITERRRPLVISSPPGLGRILRAVFDAQGTVVDPAQRFELREVEGDRFELTVGPWSVRAVPLEHSILDVGYLLERDGLSVFYTGDTREPSAARQLRADYLIHEATYPDALASRAKEFGHSTGTDAARTAVAMGARRLLMNHLGDLPDADAEVAREAKAVFPDSLVADDRMTVDL